jgi:uncharacterized membrane protein
LLLLGLELVLVLMLVLVLVLVLVLGLVLLGVCLFLCLMLVLVLILLRRITTSCGRVPLRLAVHRHSCRRLQQTQVQFQPSQIDQKCLSNHVSFADRRI